MSPLWNYFDKIILMTIPTSQRVPLARKQLAKMGIDNYKVKTVKPAQKKFNYVKVIISFWKKLKFIHILLLKSG